MTRDKDEEACARLGPKWADYPTLNVSSVKIEGIITHTKSRWSRLRTGCPEEQDQDLTHFPKYKEHTPEVIAAESECRMVHNPKTKVVDFRNLTVTDLKDNPRVHFPPERPHKEEMTMATAEELWMTAYKRYMDKYCNDKGRICLDNMTKSESRVF